MNVGIVYVAGVFFDGRRYTTDAYQHHQFAPIARRLGHIDLVTFLRNTPERTGRETLCVQNMTVLGLPFCEDGWQLYVTRTIRWVPALIRTLWRHRKAWDAVILYDLLLPNQIAYLACRILGIPVVLMVQGHVAEGMRQAHRDDRGPKRWLGRVYARWLAVSQRLLVRRTPTIADFIPSGASSVNGQPGRFMLYSGAIVSGSEVESSLMERTGDPVLLMVARVCPIKGVEFAIEATALLRERGMPVTLRVVGPLYGDAYGGYQYRLEGLIRARGLVESVTLTGPRPFGDALMREYRRARMLLVPSLSEGVPKVLCEAMAKGLPVVASDVGGLAWVLRTYGGGVLVPPRDPARLAAGVLEVEAAWARFSREALAVARELTVEVQSARVAEFIRAAVGQPTAAGAAPR